ncbi:uncharacterized protein N7477_005332 [Penicillium maclennaniae]|uniref:uncharacterized protein n=1 Tax=Penicillium maclennaniae TaxID=1343394 RepID=UPI0025417166|nr:uncharacterized protein N7477_005332 [Penicillium maclennaniae]KAJ5669969.1 hypothetical protein N7477_005332 [Penicillium maclennaniae]
MSLQERFPAYGGRGPSDFRLGISLGVIATTFMVLRIYVRLRINKFGTTALLLSLLAWFFTMLTQVFGLLSVLHGLGNHMALIMKVGQLHNFLLFTWITVFFFNLAIPTGKVAVAAFLIEMNGQGNPKIRKSLVAVAVLNIVLNIPQILLVWFQCRPVDALWDPLRQSDCDHRKSVYYTYFVGAVAAISDFYLATVPIQMLLPLRIDRKLKWGLGFLMGCGVFAGVAAIVRTWAAKFILTEDSSYGVGTLFLWGEVEEWIVLITMSIPPVWPLFRPFTSKFIKSNHTRSQRRYNDQYGYKYNSKGPYSTTAVGDQSPGFPPANFPPPLVTTTISISSAKETATIAASEDETRLSNEHTPRNLVHDKAVQPWVEMDEIRGRRSP